MHNGIRELGNYTESIWIDRESHKLAKEEHVTNIVATSSVLQAKEPYPGIHNVPKLFHVPGTKAARYIANLVRSIKWRAYIA